MSASIKLPPQTKEQICAGQLCLPINTEDMTAVSRESRQSDLHAKTDEPFYSLLYQTSIPVCYIMLDKAFMANL